MDKLRFWLIKKLVRKTPVLMNVTIKTKGIVSINGAEEQSIIKDFYVINADERRM